MMEKYFQVVSKIKNVANKDFINLYFIHINRTKPDFSRKKNVKLLPILYSYFNNILS